MERGECPYCGEIDELIEDESGEFICALCAEHFANSGHDLEDYGNE